MDIEGFHLYHKGSEVVLNQQRVCTAQAYVGKSRESLYKTNAA